MPAVQPVAPPPREQWVRVLRRYDRDPRLPWRIAGYDVNLQAKPVAMHGRIAPTVFFPPGKDAAAHHACVLGWKDETAEFLAFLGGAPAPVKAGVPPVPVVGGLRGEELLAYLTKMAAMPTHGRIGGYNWLRKLAGRHGINGRIPTAMMIHDLCDALDKRGGLTPEE